MAESKSGFFADPKLRRYALYGALGAILVVVLIIVFTSDGDPAPVQTDGLTGGPQFGGGPPQFGGDVGQDGQPEPPANDEREDEPAASTPAWSLEDLDPNHDPFLVVAPEPLVLVAPPEDPLLPGERVELVPPPAGHSSSTFRVVAEPRGPDTATLPQVELPVGFRVPDRLSDGSRMRYDASGWPLEIVCEADGSLMVFVPGGQYVRGRDDTDHPEEGPEHTVVLDPFYIDKYEITLDQYREFLGNRPLPAEIEQLGLSGDHPVVGITYQEALQYARRVGRSLPTEAQWEAAARGPQGLIRPWLGRPLWEQPREPGQLDPVGSYRMDRSPFGCMDMAGNAREWCLDVYAPDAYDQTLRRASAGAGEPSIVVEPRGPVGSGGTARVVRGGADDWRLTWRGAVDLSERAMNVGLRLVWDPPAAGASEREPE